jgi:hypothetical protein
MESGHLPEELCPSFLIEGKLVAKVIPLGVMKG